MVKELEVQRKKCEVMTEKYNSLKGLFNKDRFIGITVKEEESNNYQPTSSNNINIPGNSVGNNFNFNNNNNNNNNNGFGNTMASNMMLGPATNNQFRDRRM